MTFQVWQQVMAEAIRGQHSPEQLLDQCGGEMASAGLAIYRNHFLLSLLDALAATYPVTRLWLGNRAFDSLARAFVRACPPGSGCLADYGGAFPDWLAQARPEDHGCQALGHLEWRMERVGMARLPHTFPFDALAALDPADYERVHFAAAPGVRLHLADFDVVDLYDRLREREGTVKTGQPTSIAQQVYERASLAWALYRSEGGVIVWKLGSAERELLETCLAGQALAEVGGGLAPRHLDALSALVQKGLIERFTLGGKSHELA